MTAAEIEKTDPWWDCPVCGQTTEITREGGSVTGRECSVCDWEFTFPQYRGESV